MKRFGYDGIQPATRAGVANTNIRRESATRRSVRLFQEVFREQGLHAALGFLNARTRHRYTGAYRFEPPMLRSVALFDREQPRLNAAVVRPLQDTYCALVASTGRPFTTENSLDDLELRGHPARNEIVAYHAEPLFDSESRCFGSLCHWDVRPRLVSPDEVQVLREIAPLIAATLLAPPTPLREGLRA